MSHGQPAHRQGEGTDPSVARTRRRRLLLLGGGVVAAVLAAAVVTGIVTSIDPSQWDLASLGAATYALAGGFAFMEVGTPLGLIAPSELAVPFAGAAAAAGAVGLLPLIGVVWLCGALGDTAGFFTGRAAGDRLLTRLRRRWPSTTRHHAALAGHFSRHGAATVIAGRWLPYARTATPLVAGASGMRYRRFLPASIVGSGVWSAGMCTLGYAAYSSIGTATDWVGRAGLVALGLILAAFVVRRRVRRRPARRRSGPGGPLHHSG